MGATCSIRSATGQETTTTAILRTQKKCTSFSRTEKLRQQYTAIFQGKENYVRNASRFFKDV
ncbi:hypothetical protein [Virgibacillus proomii]|uniref:hypothetical protein n=1 Tax=Virgibacillus proomii TaxID=84407 RepID=UPI001C1045FA|nr:hypothetical protein [Virgibacillus proomii]MBU5266002.1 hypothetical protein [Virgibacillus proomii]